MKLYRNKSKSTHRRSRKKSTTRSLAGTWLFVGMFLGVLAAIFAYGAYTKQWNLNLKNVKKTEINYQSKNGYTTKTIETTRTIEKIQEHPRTTPKKLQRTIAPQYEFYTLLPGMEVQPPDQHKTNTKTNHTTNTTNTGKKQKNKTLYILQAGIFRETAKAEELKARLLLRGFSPHIQKVRTQEGQEWQRVTLGPFNSETLALNQKKKLEQQKIKVNLILQRPTEER